MTGNVCGVEQSHVYGPIDLAAVSGVGTLERRGRELVWPARFEPLE